MAGDHDTRAIELASQALARIEAHEVDCDRRYQEGAAMARETRDDMRAITTAISAQTTTTQAALGRIHGRLDKILWCVLGGAVLLIGWLLVNGTPYVLNR